jgi:hypothetical protein
MKTRQLWLAGLAGFASYGLSADSFAALVSSYQFNGKGNWSIDAVGGNSSPVGSVSAVVPVGSVIQKAFLYSSQYNLDTGATVVPTVSFQGNVIGGASWTALGTYKPNGSSFPSFALGAYRADVTGLVTSLVGGGAAAPFSFTIDREDPTGLIDGEILAIVYSNPGEQERTIAFLDGFSTSGGDSTTINLGSPLTAAQLADPAFDAQLSLGIGFGAGGDQFSTVDVNGARLTSSAGGADDGSLANGALITAGGIGDNPANPVDPNSNGSADDELYTLKPFLTAGLSQIVVETENPSLDDNIFFAGLNLTAVAGINEPPPPNGVPEHGGTFALLGLALLGLAKARRHAVK